MATSDDKRGNDPRMEATTLYLEEVFTDRRIGTIRRLTPVKPDATTDVARPVIYVGETQVMTQVGTLPIVFEIPAGTLEDAAKQFGELAKEAIDRTMKELQELRRQAASSIVVPQGGIPGGGIPGAGGMPGGGKIQLP
jgi:hypothetical protein